MLFRMCTISQILATIPQKKGVDELEKLDLSQVQLITCEDKVLACYTVCIDKRSEYVHNRPRKNGWHPTNEYAPLSCDDIHLMNKRKCNPWLNGVKIFKNASRQECKLWMRTGCWSNFSRFIGGKTYTNNKLVVKVDIHNCSSYADTFLDMFLQNLLKQKSLFYQTIAGDWWG